MKFYKLCKLYCNSQWTIHCTLYATLSFYKLVLAFKCNSCYFLSLDGPNMHKIDAKA